MSGSNFLGQFQLFVNDGSSVSPTITAATIDAANTSIFSTTAFLTGSVRIGTTAPTARLHINAGTTAASTAPLKFTSGSLLTAAEAGAMEFLTDAFYGTITTGAARKTFAFLESPIFVTPTLGSASATSILFGNGTAAAPSISFTNFTGSGFHIGAGSVPVMSVNGVAYVGWYADIVQMKSSVVLGWAATTINSATDVRLSRVAAGQMNLTAAANGVGFDVATDAVFKIRTRAQTGDASLTALDLTASGVLGVTGVTTFGAPAKLKNYTVATLPAGVQGYVAYVTDLLAPTFLVVATGGGAVIGPVFYDGTNWVSF